MNEMDIQTNRDFWVNVSFDYAVLDATGLSGVILAVLYRDSFTQHCVIVDYNFLAVEITWRSKDIILMIVTVYDPQELATKKRLWNALT